MEIKKKLYQKCTFIYIRNNQVLVVRNKGNHIFFLPGGSKENKESRKKALIREIKEELEVNLIPNTIKYITSIRSPTYEDPVNSDVIMHCYFGKYEGFLQASNEVCEFKWINYADKNITSQADKLVLNYLKKHSFIE